MRKVFIIILLFIIGTVWCNSLPVVENFEFAQRRDGSKLVDVFYDVMDTDGDTLSVSMLVSDDGGERWEVSCDSLSGDVGDNIMTGTGKQIVWNFGAEHPGTFGNNYIVRLLVDDHFVDLEIDWCLVPAGEFTWGENDEIQTIDYDYEIMKYEVTNIQYLAYLEEALAAGDAWIQSGDVYGHYDGDENYEAGDYAFYDLGSPLSSYNYGLISYDGSSFIINVPSNYSAGDFDDHPVVQVSWFGSNAYSEYYGWRLPTEQEWEKAARGMTGYDYPWGDVISGDRANYWDSGDPWEYGTTPVGYYNGENGTTDSPSPYGCYDMCGNVFDWTDSWYEPYSSRVLRGGSWYGFSNFYYFRSWYRNVVYPTYSNINIGFRCARTVR
ncbi:MAG: SUMF1/EgtB/PvdO family nonheme iron enzyme [Candidatus Stygibacter frigidus]|nr:SUMF1/EgtB/PvdO family nonheme iron enzyme [Candidatus Stygibacter frigidus]